MAARLEGGGDNDGQGGGHETGRLDLGSTVGGGGRLGGGTRSALRDSVGSGRGHAINERKGRGELNDQKVKLRW